MFSKWFGRKPKPTQAGLLKALRDVQAPDGDIVSSGLVLNLTLTGRDVSLDVKPQADILREHITDALQNAGARRIDLRRVEPQLKKGKTGLPAKILAVASGKGGVGKSTVAANLAIALSARGFRVALVDCDIYGPSVPALMGVSQQPEIDNENNFIPLTAHGLTLFSMGFLIGPGQPAIWRGPMVHKTIQQFLYQVRWGAPDYMILDLPPGTGDVQLSLAQTGCLSAGLVVTTPQEVAVADARKGIEMFRSVKIPVIGIVENMAWYNCGKCSKKHFLFGMEGGSRIAAEFGLPMLGQIPFDPAAGGSHSGKPVLARGDNEGLNQAFFQLAETVHESVITLPKPMPDPKKPEPAWAKPSPGAFEV